MSSSRLRAVVGVTLIAIVLAFFPWNGATVQAQTSSSTASTSEKIRQEIMDFITSSNDPGLIDTNYVPPVEASIIDLPADYRKIPLVVDFTPEIPGANQKVNIALESYSADLNRSEITWTLNGKVAKKGIGQKNFTFTTGKLGTVTSLTITVATQDGNVSSESYKISPAEVDIVWEALTYTPPFYKGRALPSYQSVVKLIAVPNMLQDGVKIPSSKLIYKWKKGGEIINTASGFGRNTLFVNETVPLDETTYEVEASSIDGKVVAKASIPLRQVPPRVAIYENNPLDGIHFEKALFTNYDLKNSEAEFISVPYFFSTSKRDASLQYDWQINSISIGSKRGSKISFTGGEDREGTVRIGVVVKNVERVFQVGKALTNFTVETGADNSVSF